MKYDFQFRTLIHSQNLAMLYSAYVKVYGMAKNGLIIEINLLLTDEQGASSVLPKLWPEYGLIQIESEGITEDINRTIDLGDLNTQSELLNAKSQLALFAMENLKDEIAIHAAALRFQSKFIVFPGKSFSGKSNLMLTALTLPKNLDIEVLGDEYVIINVQTLKASNYTRPIQIRDALGQKALLKHDLVKQAFRITDVIFAQYQETITNNEVATNVITLLDAAQTSMGLMSNVIQAHRSPHDSFAVCNSIAREATGYATYRGDAVEFLYLMIEYLSE